MKTNGLTQMLKCKRGAKRTCQIWSLNQVRRQASRTWCKSQAGTICGHSMMFSMSGNNHPTNGRGVPTRRASISSTRQRSPCQRRRRRRRSAKPATLQDRCPCRIENNQIRVHRTLAQWQLLAMLKAILMKYSWIHNTHLISSHQQSKLQGSKRPPRLRCEIV